MTKTRKKILILCPYPKGVAAGQRLKYEQYFNDWNRLGWDVTVQPFMSASLWSVVYLEGYYVRKLTGVLLGNIQRLFLLTQVRRYHVVYVFMWVTPFGTTIFERVVRFLSKRLIYDLEDNLLEPTSENGAVYNPNWIIRFVRSNNKAKYLVREADHVIVSSPFLRELCGKSYGANRCTYITSSVDTGRLRPRDVMDRSSVTLGWTGTFSSMGFLEGIRSVLQQLAQRLEFKLIIIGNFDYEVPGVDCEVIRWSLEHEVIDLQRIDIGLYPLPMNDWVNGKSGLKAIQYMAIGIPVVASRIGINEHIIDHGNTGFLATNDEDWINFLSLLIIDKSERRRIGKNAREIACRRFSCNVVSTSYSQVLDETYFNTEPKHGT